MEIFVGTLIGAGIVVGLIAVIYLILMAEGMSR